MSIEIITSKNISKQERDSIRKAYSKNNRFFKIHLPILKIVICHTAKEWKINSKYYYFEFARGVVLRDGTVVVKSKKFANRTLKAWEKIVAHEINHSYWANFRKSRNNLWSPIWLVEGIACYVAKNDVVASKRKLPSILKKMDRKKRFPFKYRASLFKGVDDVKNLYTLWAHFVEWLVSSRLLTDRKLIRLIGQGTTALNFESEFLNVAGISLKSAIEMFLNKKP